MDETGKKLEETASLSQAPERNIGYDFIAAVFGGGLLGYGLDRLFGTAPWCLIGLVMAGFVAGIINAWFAMKNAK